MKLITHLHLVLSVRLHEACLFTLFVYMVQYLDTGMFTFTFISFQAARISGNESDESF